MKLDPEFLQTKVLGGCYLKRTPQFNPTFDNPNDFDLLRRRFIELEVWCIFDQWLVYGTSCNFIYDWEQLDWADKCLYMQQFAMERPELFEGGE